jgi:predicted DCC family thiol-disulfide oxidoreductase YuxK
MEMSTNYPLTLLYDASCPVCSLEMDHLRERNVDGLLRFVDITTDGFDPAVYGTTLDALNAEIHAVRPDGSVIRGVQVLRLAYAAAGIGWVLRPTGWPMLRPLFDAGYRLFARHRQRISRVAAPVIDAVRERRARQTSERMRACLDAGEGRACAVTGGREPPPRSVR